MNIAWSNPFAPKSPAIKPLNEKSLPFIVGVIVVVPVVQVLSFVFLYS